MISTGRSKCRDSKFERKLYLCTRIFGVWRSWLAHLHGVQRVGRSSRLTPTKNACEKITGIFIYVFPDGQRNQYLASFTYSPLSKMAMFF